MITNRRIPGFLSLLAALLFVLAGCDSTAPLDESAAESGEIRARFNANPAASHTYEVTIENLTVGQPLSPGLLVTH